MFPECKLLLTDLCIPFTSDTNYLLCCTFLKKGIWIMKSVWSVATQLCKESCNRKFMAVPAQNYHRPSEPLNPVPTTPNHPNYLFSWGFPTKILYTFLISPIQHPLLFTKPKSLISSTTALIFLWKSCINTLRSLMFCRKSLSQTQFERLKPFYRAPNDL
jgi:hypothetical protein